MNIIDEKNVRAQPLKSDEVVIYMQPCRRSNITT
jgi:hypothetical protein